MAKLTPHRSHTVGEEGYLTPTIESPHHPANIRARQARKQRRRRGHVDSDSDDDQGSLSPNVPVSYFPSMVEASNTNRNAIVESRNHFRRSPSRSQHDNSIDTNPSGSSTSATTDVGISVSDRNDRKLKNSINGVDRRDERHDHDQSHTYHLTWKERMRHVTWAYFTLTMATGGIANVLHTIPFQSEWLYAIGLVFFFLNIALYLLIWVMISTRFMYFPHTFTASFTHPTESLFVPAFVVSLGTILITIVEYGADHAGPWLTNAVLGLFWFDAAISFILSITIYMILWSTQSFTIAQMTPIWIFPAYPLLIVGPHAANLSAKLHETNSDHAIQVIVGGFTVQGIGLLVSLTIYSAFVYRLMTQKLPAEPLRPGMFVSVGPSAFTCSGTIGMAENLHRAILARTDGVVPDASGNGTVDATFMGVPALLAAQILKLVANWMSLWLWGLALWFFTISLVSNIAPLLKHHKTSVPDDNDNDIRPDTTKGVTEADTTTGARTSTALKFAWPHSDRRRAKSKKGKRKMIPFAMTWYSFIFPQTALCTATFRIADAFGVYPLQILGCVMSGLVVAMWIFVVGMMIRAIMTKQILWPEKGEDKEEGGFTHDNIRDIRASISRSINTALSRANIVSGNELGVGGGGGSSSSTRRTLSGTNRGRTDRKRRGGGRWERNGNGGIKMST